MYALIFGILIISIVSFVVAMILSEDLRDEIKPPLLVGLFFAVGIVIMSLLSAMERDEWRDRNFSGEIIKKEVTSNHALVAFTLNDGESEIVVLDRHWKMNSYEVGDHVIKEAGSADVILLEE